MSVFAGFLVWFVGLILMLALSQWVLGPLENAAKAGPRGLRFTLSDWFCLIGMIQVWAAGVHSIAAMAGADLKGALVFDAFDLRSGLRHGAVHAAGVGGNGRA